MSSEKNERSRSKNEFLATINVGYKSEYEFESGLKYFEFISREFGHDRENEQKHDLTVNEKVISPSKIVREHINTKFQQDIRDGPINKELDNMNTQWDFKKASPYIRIIVGETNKCYICDKSFPTRRKKNEHISTHLQTQSELFKCPFCGKSFIEKNELSKHFTTHLIKTTILPNTQCHICSKVFTRKSNLKRHLDTIHASKEISFKCEDCSQVFTKRCYLIRHQQVHYWEKNKDSKVIFKSTNRSLIKNSRRYKKNQKFISNPKIVGKKSELKCFKCKHCRLKFKRKYHLQRHAIVHIRKKQIQSLIGLKLFSTSCHMRNHIAKKKYDCKLCNKKFYSLNNFRHHSKEHKELSD